MAHLRSVKLPRARCAAQEGPVGSKRPKQVVCHGSLFPKDGPAGCGHRPSKRATMRASKPVSGGCIPRRARIGRNHDLPALRAAFDLPCSGARRRPGSADSQHACARRQTRRRARHQPPRNLVLNRASSHRRFPHRPPVQRRLQLHHRRGRHPADHSLAGAQPLHSRPPRAPRWKDLAAAAGRHRRRRVHPHAARRRHRQPPQAVRHRSGGRCQRFSPSTASAST